MDRLLNLRPPPATVLAGAADPTNAVASPRARPCLCRRRRQLPLGAPAAAARPGPPEWALSHLQALSRPALSPTHAILPCRTLAAGRRRAAVIAQAHNPAQPPKAAMAEAPAIDGPILDNAM